MRAYLPLILLLFASYFGFGQNYQCLQTGTKRYFTNADGYVRGMRIDSVRVSGSDVIYYPFHTLRGRYNYMGSPMPLNKNGGSWLGGKVVQKSNGTFLFDNMWHDTVVITTQAGIGATWVLYNDTTKRFYQAYLASVDTMTVLGVLDTIKRIDIMAYDDTGYVPSDPANNCNIVISKNHGFVKVCDLYTFPYHAPDSVYKEGLDYYLDALKHNTMFFSNYHPAAPDAYNFSLTQIPNATLAQIYDRDPGDVFQYRICADYHGNWCVNPYQYLFDSVENKVTAATYVSYRYLGWVATQQGVVSGPNTNFPYPYDITPKVSIDTFRSTLLIDTMLMPEEYGWRDLLYFYSADTSYCMSSNLYRFSQSEIMDTTWLNIHFESTGEQVTYKTGLGLVQRYQFFHGHDGMRAKTLIYHKKGVPYCGNYIVPIRVGINEQVRGESDYELYPNPVGDRVTVRSGVVINDIVVIDILGSIRYRAGGGGMRVDVDVSGLAPGLYFVRINNAITKKFIKR